MKIGIIFANCKGNLGDFAILDAMVRHLSARFPINEIDIFPDPGIRFSAAHVSLFVQYLGIPVNWKMCTPSYTSPSWEKRLEKWGKRTGVWKHYTQYLTTGHSKRLSENMAVFDDYSLVVVAGGGLWGARPVTKFGLLRGLRGRNIPVFCYPFTAAWPMWYDNTKGAIVHAFLALSHPPLVRELLTQGRFEEAGIKSEYCPDVAFLLSSAVREIPPREDVTNTRVLLCLTRRRKNRSQRKVGRNKTVFTLDEENVGSTFRKLQDAGLAIELISTCASEDEGWMGQMQRGHTLQIHTPRTWQQFCAEVKSSACLVTNRLHGAILGMLSGVPVVLVSDSDKTEGLKGTFPDLIDIDKLADLDSAFVVSVMEKCEEILAIQSRIVEQSVEKLNLLRVSGLK